MQPISRRGFGALGLAAGCAVTARPALAAWPADDPIMVVVPFPPGGGVDQMARLLLPHVQRHLPGASFVVENRPGAGSQVGMEYAFRARPDGYTLCAVTSPALMTMPIERPVQYRVADFVFLANAVDDPGALWVRGNSPIRSFADLLDRARRAPGTVTLGTTGIGSDDHLVQLEIESAMPGVSFSHVPFAGSAPMLTALLGGHIDVASFNLSEGVNGQRDGTLRCLGQATAERDAMLPEAPTLREQGSGVVSGAQRGFVAPPGLPDAIRDRLVQAFRAALADPAFLADARRVQMPVRAVVGDEYRATVLGLDARLKEMWARKPWRE